MSDYGTAMALLGSISMNVLAAWMWCLALAERRRNVQALRLKERQRQYERSWS